MQYWMRMAGVLFDLKEILTSIEFWFYIDIMTNLRETIKFVGTISMSEGSKWEIGKIDLFNVLCFDRWCRGNKPCYKNNETI